MEDLAARLAALEAERAVLANLYQYGHSIDYGLRDRWLDCFTEDAVYDLRYRAGLELRSRRGGTPTDHGVVYRGQVELAVFIAGHTHAPDRWHKHMLMEPVVTLTDGRARCRSYFARLDERPDGPYIRAFGRYLDQLVECPDGRWRFEERIAQIESIQR
jgi:hypothetical protein